MRKEHDRFLKTAEVAEMLGCTTTTVLNHVKEKRIPHVVVGKSYKFSYKAIVKYLKRNTVSCDDPCKFCSTDKPTPLLEETINGTPVAVFIESEFISLSKNHDKEEFDDYLDTTNLQISYCPNCGRKL